VSDFDRVFLRKAPFVPARDEASGDPDVDHAPETEAPPAGREGLPPSFRMRADSHYVDLLASRAPVPAVQMIAIKDIAAEPIEPRDLAPLVESIRSLGVVQPLIVRRRKGQYALIAGARRLAAASAAGLTEVPCLLREANDERARALAEAENLRIGPEPPQEAAAEPSAGVPAIAAREIIDSLATIESCLNLFLMRDRPLRERVAVGLVKAEAHRARWLAEAYSLLGGEPSVVRRVFSASGLVGRTLQGLEAEGRLSNIKLVLAVDEPTRPVCADERLLSLAMTGAAAAMMGLLQGLGEATLKVRVGTHPATRMLAVQFAQELVPAPAGLQPASSSGALPDWPGGHGAALGLAVARRVMDLHGGHVEVGAGPRAGCTLTLTLPAAD
jgi:ParB-like chromosome segregation protein Spo0J